MDHGHLYSQVRCFCYMLDRGYTNAMHGWPNSNAGLAGMKETAFSNFLLSLKELKVRLHVRNVACIPRTDGAMKNVVA